MPVNNILEYLQVLRYDMKISAIFFFGEKVTVTATVLGPVTHVIFQEMDFRLIFPE